MAERCIHAHLLLRADGTLHGHAHEAAEVAGLAATLREVESAEAVARYVVKHTKKLAKKAELAPGDFRGRLYRATLNFLTRPLKELRKKLWEEAKKGFQWPTPDRTGSRREDAR